jgi:prepilin-type N-terminal cleavage/methylation domain-containing protein
MRKQKGFSLIELLIVVAIILIIAAIAIPNLLRSRMAANEASAVGSVRTLNTAQVTYASTYPDIGFAVALSNLGPTAAGVGGTSTNSGLVDGILGCAAAPCKKSGYQFTVVGGPSGCGAAGAPCSTYTAIGDPQTAGQTGQRYFCSDQSGVIRYDVTAAIGANAGANCDPAIAPLQ